jgi:N-terminal domain of molybdenum-binding protein
MIEVECYISIKRNGISFLDPVKTRLLSEIKESGSLNGAAKKLEISYQHAWTMINEMNNAAPEPLVSKQRGGAHGGGAVVTSYGEKILKDYFAINSQVNKVVGQINVEINL